jgi:hypothetical protein
MAATIQTAIPGISQGLAGGASSAINITSAQVIKAGPGVCVKLVCIAAGTIALNDSLTVAAAAATNNFFPSALAMTAGQAIELNWPCGVGIVASVVTGIFSLAFS